MAAIRKFSFYALWFLLIGAVAGGFLWFQTRMPAKSNSRLALPESTAIVIECASFPELLADLHSNNKMWKALSNDGALGQTITSMNLIDSLIKKDPRIQQFPLKKLTISISLKANKAPGVLFCLPVSVRKQDKEFVKILASQVKEFNQIKRRYEGSTIYDLSWKEPSGSRFFSFTVLKGIMIGSFSAELVEESIKQFNPDKNIATTPEFIALTRTIGNKVPVNIFINYKNAAGLFRYFLDPIRAQQSEGIKNFASWGALDAEIFANKIILNGFTSLSDSLKEELRLFRNQEPVEFTSPSFLPDAISFFKIYSVSNKELYFKQLADYLKSSPGSKDLLKRRTELFNNYNIDLGRVFEEVIADEYGLAMMQSGRTSAPFFFMELKSQSLAEQQFLDWIALWALKNNRPPSEFKIDYKIDNNNTISVYKLPLGGIPSMVFGPEFASPENDYFAFINNFLVFADSYASIKEFIYKVVLGNTLSSGTSYTSLGDNISSRSNFYLFAKPASILESSDEYLSAPARQFLHDSKESLSGFNAVALQYSSAEELIYTHLFINYSGEYSGSVNTVWKSRIDTTTVFKPAIVANHLTGEKEIFIQDQKNQIYLLSNAGVVLWKQMIDGPMISDVFQIDYYKNGKLQYLFSTQNKIYLLDRNGNPVEKFPIELRSPATAGISVFDYDRDGTMRICVPCEDRKIYMYDKEGKVIPAWQPDRTDNPVSQPVQHFRVGSKDYIVAIDRFKFYILDRKGQNRVTVKQYFQVSANNPFYLDISRGEGLARLVTTDTTGNIMRVYFSGKVEKILDRKVDPSHYFVFADINGDQRGEFLTAEGKTLQVLNPDLSESFKLEFNDEISFRPLVYKFSATDNKIGVVLKNPGNIYLYNNNGSLYNGFPLEGSAPFSISSFPELGGRFNMIVGTKNNFLYNYSVQ